MDKLSEICKPIQNELEQFKELFQLSLMHDDMLLNQALDLVKQQSGKMMRPILMLLLAKLQGRVSKETFHAAIAFELLHTASLTHDDVVDGSDMRRGMTSLNASFGNKVAVLTGDYLLAKALYHSSLTHHTGIVKILSGIGADLSEGEIIQLEVSSSREYTEEAYFKIVRKKTASLFSACAQAAVFSANASAFAVEQAKKFGDAIGICFQIKDDIFDYYTSLNIGKPTGSDMLDRKLTLPVIYALEHYGDDEHIKMAHLVREGEATSEVVKSLIDFTIQHGGISYAEKVMEKYKSDAFSLLASYPDSAEKKSLKLYLEFVMDREK